MDKYRKCKSEDCNLPVAPNRTVCQPCHNSLVNYGITRPEAQAILDNQDNVCEICNNKIAFTGKRSATNKDAVVDHCHSTGKIRGILCGKCNLGLGRFDDDTNRLYNAISYLGESNVKSIHNWSWTSIISTSGKSVADVIFGAVVVYAPEILQLISKAINL